MMVQASRVWIRVGMSLLSIPNRFWSALDSDAIKVYQATVYTLIFVAGWDMVLIGVPKALDNALYDGVQNLWVVMCVAGPPMTLAGVMWERHDLYVARLVQMSGNLMIGFVFMAYVLAVIQENWGSGIFAPFIFIGLGLWSLLLAIRDVRKTVSTERDVRKSACERALRES